MKTNLFKIALIILVIIGIKTKAQPGAALNFDGVNDRVIITNSTLGALTIEFWMRTTQVGLGTTQWFQGTGLVDAEVSGVVNDFGTSLVGNKLAFGIGNPDVTLMSTSNVNTGNWVHVAAVFTSASGGVAWLYINGVLEATSTLVSSNARNTNASINFGRIQSTGANYYNGDLDEVRIWDYTRSQCQIKNHMNCELTSTEGGLLYYYQFNQGIAAGTNTAITTVTNLMGGNNGNFSTFAKVGATSNFIASGGVTSGVTCNPLSVNVQGNGTNITDGATTSTTLNATNFGSVCPNTTPITNVYTIQNNGTSTVTLNTFTITGANASSFSITSTTPTSLAVGATATFAVTFSTSTVGTKVATMAFNTTDCAFPTYNYALGATVVGAPTIAVNSGTICSGNLFVITPSGASTYTFSSGSATVSPLSTTNYTVVGTSSLGCAGTNTAISTVSVIITPTVIVNSGAICNGQSFTLVPSGAASYTYSSGSAIVTPSVSSSFSITGSNGSCLSTNTAIANVTVNATPTVVVSVANSTACAGLSNTLSASGAISYTFNPGNIISSSAIVSPTVTTTYTAIGTDGTCNNTKTISIVVNPLPVVTIGGSNSLCTGNSLTITSNGAATYTWNTSATSNSIVISPTITTTYSVVGTSTNSCQNFAIKTITVNSIPTIAVNSGSICSGKSFTIIASGASTYTYSGGSAIVSPTTATNYTVTGTSAQGCVASNTVVSSVLVSPSPTVIAVSSSSVICSGATVTITATGANSYSWSTSSTASAIVVSPTINTTYVVTGTGVNGCSTSVLRPITVNPKPIINVNSGTTCSGDLFTINPTGASTYTFLNGGPVVSPTISSTYLVIGTSALGCVSSNTAVSTINVNALPIVSATTSSVDICPSQFAILNASGANSYIWSTGAFTQSIIVFPFVTTTYSVTGTDLNGCENTAIITQLVNCGLPTAIKLNNFNSLNINLYPNPTNGNITVETDNDSKICIINCLGKLVYSNNELNNKHSINITAFENGIYFVQINSVGYTKVIKVIKQ